MFVLIREGQCDDSIYRAEPLNNLPKLAATGVVKVLVASAEQLQENSLLDVHVLVDARSWPHHTEHNGIETEDTQKRTNLHQLQTQCYC